MHASLGEAGYPRLAYSLRRRTIAPRQAGGLCEATGSASSPLLDGRKSVPSTPRINMHLHASPSLGVTGYPRLCEVMRTSRGAIDRPIHKDGRRQLLLVGRLPHVSCSLLTSGRPESRLHKRGSCGLRVGLRPGCHVNKPRCNLNRPSYPQGRALAAPAGRSAPTCVM